jgi:hypothetical protein
MLFHLLFFRFAPAQFPQLPVRNKSIDEPTHSYNEHRLRLRNTPEMHLSTTDSLQSNAIKMCESVRQMCDIAERVTGLCENKETNVVESNQGWITLQVLFIYIFSKLLTFGRRHGVKRE